VSIVGSGPYAIGSTNGSAWNAAFVFNGVDRLGASPALHGSGHRHRLTISPPGPARLLARQGQLPIARLGLELLAALALGLPALWAQRKRSQTTRAIAATLALWVVTGATLFSAMARLHPRYTEAMNPATAACLGIGVAWLGQVGGWRRVVSGATALALAAYAVWATFGSTWASGGVGLAAAGLVVGAWGGGRVASRRRWRSGGASCPAGVRPDHRRTARGADGRSHPHSPAAPVGFRPPGRDARSPCPAPVRLPTGPPRRRPLRVRIGSRD